MDRRAKLSLLALALLLGSVLGVYVVAQAAPLDPLAEFRTADGGLSIPGGMLTPELQRLIFPAKSPDTYWTYAPAYSAYPTLAIEGTERTAPRAPQSAPTPVKPVGTDSLKVFFDALLRLPKSIVSFFDSLSPIGTAAAAERFLVLGDADCTVTAIATDGGCWASTSGGTDIAGVPGAADDFNADANSGAGTGTLDAAMSFVNMDLAGFTGIINAASFAFTISGSVTISSSGAIQLGSSTHTVAGIWTNNSTDADWDKGTGQIDFTSATGGTMTFAGTNLAEDEFNSVRFASSSGTVQTFTMSTRGLRWGDSLSLRSVTVLDKATFSLTGGALSIAADASASGLVSTSGDSTLTSSNNTSMFVEENGYIDFGSETWTISGTSGTCIDVSGGGVALDVAWDKGTGTVVLDCSVDSSIFFAGALLPEDQFNNVRFASSSGTAQTFTMSGQNLRAASITINDASSTTTLNADTLDLQFASLTVETGGRLTMNAATSQAFEMSTSSGTISLTTWTSYNAAAANATAVAWTFNPDTAGATITLEFSGLTAVSTYRLLRDGSAIDTKISDGSGTVTFAVTGGWSPHAMRVDHITPAGEAGDGDEEPGPEEQPTPGPGPSVGGISLFALGLAAMLFGAVLVIIGMGMRSARLKFWGAIIFVVGLLLVLFALGFL